MALSPFRQAAAQLVADAAGLPVDKFTVKLSDKPGQGDVAVGCFPAGKQAAALAQQIASSFKPTKLLASAEASGPYVNFRVNRDELFTHLFLTADDPVPKKIGEGKTIVIDFSSPNIAKPLAYHHIRSTVIGHALVGMNRALGYRVVGVNHLGDWGASFGRILAGIKKWGLPEPMTIEKINEVYKRWEEQTKAAGVEERKENPWDQEARRALLELENGDPGARALWQKIRDVSWKEFQEIYDLLGVRFDSVKGESEYETLMAPMIALLQEKGLATESDGALVVPLEGFEAPLMLKTREGTTVYATRDLAAAKFRWDEYAFEASIYVVDRGQSLHFKQLFATLRKAGFTWAERMRHVPFGLVRMGGKKTSSRKGNIVLLKNVLAEAEEEIRKTLRETNPDLPADQAERVAHEVGVGAIIFANLASQREKDVDFDLEQMTSFKGDAGPYVQYAHARAASILRKGGGLADGEIDPSLLKTEEEWALAKQLTELGDEIARAAATDEPHMLIRYLLEVCKAFSTWYTSGNADPSLKVIGGDPATQRARLALTAATKSILKTGLNVLGISAPDEM